ncbi:MAG TPA: MFS transporter [Chitinispirillaceae bacterium]|nr:MFS transporter [Chitinispirillaceae bacterium]
MKSAFTGILNRNLLLLIQGHFINKLGTALFDVALVLWLKQQTGIASIIGIILMLSNLPEILLSPFSGTIVDMVPRKKVLIISNLIVGLIIIAISTIICLCPQKPILTLSMVITGSIVIGICTSFFNPATSSFIPELVEKEKLQMANSVYQFSSNGATFAGQCLAGVLFTLLGAPVLFIINGASYIISALFESRIFKPADRGISISRNSVGFKSVITGFEEGYSYIWSRTQLKRLLFMLCLYHFFISPFTVILPFYTSDYLKIGQAWYGYILSFFGLGLLSGFISCGFLKFSEKKQQILIIICLLISSTGYLLLGLSRNVFITSITVLLIGAAIAVIVVNFNTIIQISTPGTMHGRIFGLYNTLSTASIPVGMGFFGIFLDFLRTNTNDGSKGSAMIFIFCGSVLCLINCYFIIKHLKGDSLLHFVVCKDNPVVQTDKFTK